MRLSAGHRLWWIGFALVAGDSMRPTRRPLERVKAVRYAERDRDQLGTQELSRHQGKPRTRAGG